MSRKWFVFPAAVAVFGTMAGAFALIGILHEAGKLPPSLERAYAYHTLPSDRFAERAYRQLFTGDTAGALNLFELAVRRDPASPYRWCDYSEALLMAGDRDRARKCMLRGLELGPYVGPVLMRGVNFFYRTGETSGVLRNGAALLEITDGYDDAVFTVWDRMELPSGSILAKGIPGRRAAQAYLRHLMRSASWTRDAEVAWSWIRQRGFADDRLADEYAATLLAWHKAREAAVAWSAYAGGREPGYPAGNAVFNGGFEREPAGKAFDWRLDAAEGVRADRDPAHLSGQSSLRIQFDRTQNIAFAHVSQTVVVQPGNWRFEAYLRTEEITTNEGLGFRIFDSDAPQRLDVRTERLTGTHGWTKLSAIFTVPAETHVVQVQVVRNPSLKFDNKLGGTAWIDAVRLCPDRQ